MKEAVQAAAGGGLLGFHRANLGDAGGESRLGIKLTVRPGW